MTNVRDFKVFVDCGAPSLYNKLSRKLEKKGIMGTGFAERKYDDYSYTESKEYEAYRDRYIAFLKQYSDLITIYSNLDVINNPKLTWKNQRILEAEGLSPIPVYHLGSPEVWLKRYLDKYEYIALGGLVPNPTSVLIPILDKLFKEYILDDKGFPRVKVHGFACTSMPLMERYPWYSVDSTTCRKMAMYGSIVLPTHKKGKLVPLVVSARDSAVELKVTKGILHEIEIRAAKYGTTLETLSNSYIERTLWNILTYLEKLQMDLPVWPWSMQTRESAPGANDFLNFYVAGVFATAEEHNLWKRLSELNIDGRLKNRLQSFFYDQSLLMILDFKHPGKVTLKK